MRVAIDVIGLACCGLEAATAMAFIGDGIDVDGIRLEPYVSEAPADLYVAVVAGTVTHAVVDAVAARIGQLPQPQAVVAYGVCAASGGPYWDSYAVTQGLPAATLLVPGCPPRPEALQAALVGLAQEVQHAAL